MHLHFFKRLSSGSKALGYGVATAVSGAVTLILGVVTSPITCAKVSKNTYEHLLTPIAYIAAYETAFFAHKTAYKMRKMKSPQQACQDKSEKMEFSHTATW